MVDAFVAAGFRIVTIAEPPVAVVEANIADDAQRALAGAADPVAQRADQGGGGHAGVSSDGRAVASSGAGSVTGPSLGTGWVTVRRQRWWT